MEGKGFVVFLLHLRAIGKVRAFLSHRIRLNRPLRYDSLIMFKSKNWGNKRVVSELLSLLCRPSVRQVPTGFNVSR